MRCIQTMILSLFCLLSLAQNKAAKTVKVLFVGNSYIYYNNLPQICVGIASSTGDVLVTESSTPGGYTFENHFADSNTIKKIRNGPSNYINPRVKDNWDYVVLQEQSQLPSDSQSIVDRKVYSFAHFLDSTIHKNNDEAKTVFYMTWGRKNGDSSRCARLPLVCSYEGMDSLLATNYRTMAEKNNAILAPVGAVWKLLRKKYPTLELYNKDGSHPSEAGSYAAACCFYTVFFKKDPTSVKFNYTLDPAIASNIRKAVKQIVYDKLPKNQQ